jgi:hypothetical protein
MIKARGWQCSKSDRRWFFLAVQKHRMVVSLDGDSLGVDQIRSILQIKKFAGLQERQLVKVDQSLTVPLWIKGQISKWFIPRISFDLK